MEGRSAPAVLIALLAAVGGGGLSILSLSAAVIASGASQTIESLRAGEEADHQLVADAAERSLGAGRLFDKGRYNSEAALALGRLDEKDRQRILGQETMLGVVDQALVVAPASPHNWARRARLQLLACDIEGARRSIETSLLFGRFVPGLTVPRLSIILALLHRAPDGDLERSFEEQVRIAARLEPSELAGFADGGAAEGRVQRILSSDFALYNAYLKSLIALRADKSRAKNVS